MITCSKCELSLSKDRFYNGKECKDCRNKRTREFYKNNPDAAQKRRDSSRKWMQNNPEEYKKRQRIHHLKRFWNITIEQYEQMFKNQNGVCAICKKPETSTRGRKENQSLAIDHCHETGKIRELLCMECNQTLGKFKDDPSWFIAASEYLVKHGKVVA